MSNVKSFFFLLVVWGECNHSFHNCCMSLWVKQNNRCPLCQQDWVVQRIGKWEWWKAFPVQLSKPWGVPLSSALHRRGHPGDWFFQQKAMDHWSLRTHQRHELAFCPFYFQKFSTIKKIIYYRWSFLSLWYVSHCLEVL